MFVSLFLLLHLTEHVVALGPLDRLVHHDVDGGLRYERRAPPQLQQRRRRRRRVGRDQHRRQVVLGVIVIRVLGGSEEEEEEEGREDKERYSQSSSFRAGLLLDFDLLLWAGYFRLAGT